MNRKARGIAKKADELLDTRQKARLAQLTAIERVLVLRMLTEIRERVEERPDGTTSPQSFLKTARMVDRVFDMVEESEFGGITSALIGDMKGVLKFNADYFSAMDQRRKSAFKKIRALVDKRMRERLGITSEDGAQKGGYIDKLLTTQAAREEVKKLIAKQVQAGLPMKKLERLIRLQLQGTKTTAGVLERNLGGFVLDTYNIADAVTNKEFAKRLDLKYFTYSGGLIETSRPFCIKRNNKVFAVWETEDWDRDPTLPKTKVEKDSGVVTDYVPLEDRGRWNCRHRILYIPQEEAYRLRPELRAAEEKKFGKAA
jgi:hypothetical protein